MTPFRSLRLSPAVLLAAFLPILWAVPAPVSAVTDADLDSAHAYPVPFKTSLGHKTITFAFLPSEGDIRVYTVAGELVRRIAFANPVDGKLEWDVTNSSGENLATDTYFFIITSGSGKKTGKLIVIR
ncbi:MAG: hypothetical protein A2902_01920 [Elusimicrobia bacterium RIFCSPLOWO2_01_FULL_64_13]|nr:MAG: hypothetical protein A2902_01920 [Elusimicrobia bacterium RIFCSPLOWO2_01_FULL_64_13]